MFVLALMFCTTAEADSCRQFLYKTTFKEEYACLAEQSVAEPLMKKKILLTLNGKDPYRWETNCVPVRGYNDNSSF